MKLAFLILALLGAAGASFGLFRTTSTIEMAHNALHESADLAVELGFDPATLAVAGFDAESAGELLVRLSAATTLRTALSTAKFDSNQSCEAMTVAAEQLALNPGHPELRSTYASARQACEEADAQVASVRSELVEAALEGVSPSQVAALQTCCRSRGCAIPPAMKVLPHLPPEAAELEECLIAEARAIRRGEVFDPSKAQRLAAIRSEMEVIVAGQRLATHLVGIEAVFAGN